MTQERPDISLIISSRNRAKGLSACLDSVACAALNVSRATVEFIFVDNGSTDETATIFTDWAAKAPMETRFVYEAKPGLASARNAGIQAARGRILAFTDDDCVLMPDYFDALLRAHQAQVEPTMIGGRIELGDERDLPVTIKTERHPARLDQSVHAGGFIHGCNMSFTREVVDRIGFFDTRFGAGALFRAGEDTDYIHRAFLAAVPILYEPELVVKHFHGRRDRSTVRRLHSGYSVGNGALYAKYMFVKRSNMRGMLRWDMRMAIHEALTGKKLDAGLGLTWRETVRQSLAGMFLYWRSTIAGSS